MGTFVEMSCSKVGIMRGSSTASTSVGPIVKKYWNCTLQLCMSLTQTMSQVRIFFCIAFFSFILESKTLLMSTVFITNISLSSNNPRLSPKP